MIRKSEYIRRECQLKARIKELENIICPAEQHDFVEADVRYETRYSCGEIDTTIVRRMICKKCLHVKEVRDI